MSQQTPAHVHKRLPRGLQALSPCGRGLGFEDSSAKEPNPLRAHFGFRYEVAI